MKSQLVLGLIILTSATAHARVVREKPVEKIYKNTQCEASDSCGLTEFKVHTYNYEAIFPDGSSHGTSAFMSYKTQKVDQLENFAIVQKIKGCQFESGPSSTGEVVKKLTYAREFYNEIIPYKHPAFVIDSIDLDPMYNNWTPDRRHAAYRWNKVAGSYDKTTEVKYGATLPTRPELYVSDLPGVAFFMGGAAKNLSLQFEVCIHKTSDVPTTSRPDSEISAPIACHTWASSFIYNHKTNKFESKAEIDSFCNE